MPDSVPSVPPVQQRTGLLHLRQALRVQLFSLAEDDALRATLQAAADDVQTRIDALTQQIQNPS